MRTKRHQGAKQYGEHQQHSIQRMLVEKRLQIAELMRGLARQVATRLAAMLF